MRVRNTTPRTFYAYNTRTGETKEVQACYCTEAYRLHNNAAYEWSFPFSEASRARQLAKLGYKS